MATLSLFLASLLAVAAAVDLAKHHVPNTLVLAVAGVGFLASASRGLTAVGSGLLAMALVLVILIAFWERGVLGGGDVKLAAATALALGLERLPGFALATGVAGGLAAALAWGQWRWQRTVPPAERGEARRLRVPYGVAIAAGGVVMLAWGVR